MLCVLQNRLFRTVHTSPYCDNEYSAHDLKPHLVAVPARHAGWLPSLRRLLCGCLHLELMTCVVREGALLPQPRVHSLLALSLQLQIRQTNGHLVDSF